MVEREIQRQIEPWIKRDEILILNGPRQVGKTTLMKVYEKELREQGSPTLFLNLENPNDLLLAEDYQRFLKTVRISQKKTYVFLDEIQLHSRPSNFLKWMYDEHRSNIKVFASGSANLDIKAKLQDSLAGRKKTFDITPFYFSEFLTAKGFKKNTNPITDEQRASLLLEEFLLYGGLPKIVLEEDYSIKQDLLEEYVSTYISKDIRHLIAENNVQTFNHLLIFLSKITGNLKNNERICKELEMNRLTLKRYLDLLEKTFIVDFLHPYFTHEITRIKKAQKVYFFDTGVRNSLLSNFSPLQGRNDAGSLFENVIYYRLTERYGKQHVFYLRTKSENEIDFVCQSKTGTILGYEAKYSSYRTPTITHGISTFLQKIPFEKVIVINRNLSEAAGKVHFVDFCRFSTSNGMEEQTS
ncbi:MAG: ATP-binding protein [bacterium]|nr:ATP-binding protein [bacterium]